MFSHVTLEHESPKLKQVNDNGSRYYVTPEGKKYPSVTTVLSEYSREAIQTWRNSIGHEQASKITRQASTRGTNFHKQVEVYLKNEKPEFKTPIEVEQFNLFKPLLYRIDKIHMQEERMYSDYLRLAGTVDCIAEYDGRLSVIDFKTASKPKNKQWIENYFMQCSAYAIMFEERFKIPVTRSVVLISVAGQEPQLFIERRDKYVDQLLHFRDLYEKNSGKAIAL